MARVEPEVRIAGNEGVGREDRVRRGILDDQSVDLPNRRVAERPLPVSLGAAQTDLRLPPLPVAVDERDTDHGDAEQLFREPGHPIDAFITWSVQNVQIIQCTLACVFVDDHRQPPLRLPTS
jgi:hypothetical protein